MRPNCARWQGDKTMASGKQQVGGQSNSSERSSNASDKHEQLTSVFATTSDKRRFGRRKQAQREMAQRVAGAVSLLLVGVLATLSAAATSGAEQTERRLDRSQANLFAQPDNRPDGAQSDLVQVASDGRLVAIGRASPPPLPLPRDVAQQLGRRRDQPPSGRLIDSIATETAAPSGGGAAPDKLDYIVEFLRANKLGRFCDLLTSNANEIRNLTRQLNSLDQFTLFVPTNEALLLMKPAGKLEEIRSKPAELRHFLMAHVSAKLVVPTKLAAGLSGGGGGTWSSGRQLDQVPGAGSSLLFSLAGSQLRVTAAPRQQQRPNGTASKQLEHDELYSSQQTGLIVNGANVLAGQSYALQEPNNSSATYAVVHLVDRTLWPAPSESVWHKLELVAPRFMRYVRLAKDAQLDEQLQSSNYLSTVFVPNDEAFQATSSKLLEQLDSNRTFLRQFARSHIVDGLYFSGQLGGGSGAPRRLNSLANVDLELDSKSLQSRQLILVNTIPLVEHDLMALNGVLHLISRPIFERRLLEECRCATAPAPDDSVEGATGVPDAFELLARLAGEHSSPSFASQPPTGNGNSNELEREESNVAPSGRVRAQRSDSLVSGNNRNFYRPSTAAVELAGDTSDRLATVAPPTQLEPTSNSTSSTGRPVAAPLFEADQYKVVLNATTRQKLREQQQLGGPTAGSYAAPSAAANQFRYDQPNWTAGDETNGQRRAYAELVALPAGRNNSEQVTSSQQVAANRQQRLLKFQAEDARNFSSGGGSARNAAENWRKTRPAQQAATSLQAAYDVFSTSSSQPAASAASKSFVSATPGGVCAFYDTDCKRLLGKLVRLPPSGGIKSGAFQQQQQQQFNRSSFGNSYVNLQPATTVPTTAFGGSPNLDSTFGETNNLQVPSTTTNLGLLMRAPAGSAADEQRWRNSKAVASSAPHWPSSSSGGGGGWRNELPPADDISRIKLASGKLTAEGEAAKDSPGAQLLLVPVPVRVLQDAVLGSSLAATSSANRLPPVANRTAAAAPIYFAAPPSGGRAQLSSSQSASAITFSASNRFHTPSLRLPGESGAAGQSPFGRLTNFTVLETVPADDVSAPSAAPPQRVLSSAKARVLQAPLVQPRPPPAAFRKQPRPAQVQMDNNGSFGANFELDPTSGVKQARKLIRLQSAAKLAATSDPIANSDFSVTSAARLRAAGNQSGGGLATLASNQSPNVNFVRSVPVDSQAERPDPNADFFQNRTIAEIMDDSGLRIDGQQVTFSRLKECLARAQLLNLVADEDSSSSLTIFMPTDAAFERLVQQQAVLHQRATSSSSGSSAFGRLLGAASEPAAARSQLIPLMARAPASGAQSAALTSASELANGAATASSQLGRLTIDCSSKQARQLLLDHLSGKTVAPRQLKQDIALASLSGRQLLLSSVPQKKIVVVDGQPVIAATRAKNGMVYVINKFLNLTQQVPNVLDIIQNQPNLTTFLSYLKFSSLADRIKRETGPITILAPTNEAFEQLSPAARQLINSDPSALVDILRGHVVEGAQFGKLVSLRNRLKTMNADQTIEARVIKPNLYQLDNQMTAMRLVGTAANGVVNAIDRLIVPPWLQVSMSPTSGGAGGPTLSAPTSQVEPLELPVATSSSSRQSLNLPLLNNQPLRFEQPPPATRNLAPVSSSFLFGGSGAGSGSAGAQESPNSLVDSFGDAISVAPKLDNSQAFLRVANATGGEVAAGARLRFPSTAADVTPSGPTKNMRLINKLAELMNARKFVSLLSKSRLGEQLKPNMNYVILVPTDAAIERLPRQITETLERDTTKLSDLVSFHVLDTTFEYINTIPDGQTLNTLNEKDILFNWHRNNTILTASGAVVLGGIQEENIALLIVDRVLYPTPGDLLSIVSKSPILSNFTAIIRNAALGSQLSLTGPFTLFAPSDFAFNQLDKRDLDFLQRNRETARRFLFRHLSQPAVFTSTIALSNSSSSAAGGEQRWPQLTISNSLGEDLTLRQKSDYFSVNDVNFAYADVAGTNGVVHVIDGLL